MEANVIDETAAALKKNKILFEEKQFHGLNRHSLVRRLLLAVFCFVAYYWSENPKPVELDLFDIGEYPGRDNSGQLFFLLGICILALSAGLLFVLHMKTRVTTEGIFIDGFWSARRVFIDIKNIADVRRARLRPSFFNRPVYNLQSRGRTRFYTYGMEAIELTMRDGRVYRIGTQRPAEFMRALQGR
ncbi:MAG TPA: hypothetical protein VI731_01660 [Bacteroidia bacterium]|nr:hypothetical protein [Bacteroidia bacterium]